MKLVRRVTEAEVIAEFLKNEFYQQEYDQDREQFEQLVLDPDLTNESQNAIRRALLFRRRGHMWRELPPDTQWWQVQIGVEDLPRVRVFPRAHWRKISNGSFVVADIVDRLRKIPANGRNGPLISKIQLIRYRLQREANQSSILLIGMGENKPMTILEGNHRFTAAMLVSLDRVQTSFQILCGFSPHMDECCWYVTNLRTLWRYLKNRLQNVVDKEADVQRLLGEAFGSRQTEVSPSASYAKATEK
ncbi:MAG TPA: hypothetical protein VF493_08445 [Terriglobales bacterium]